MLQVILHDASVRHLGEAAAVIKAIIVTALVTVFGVGFVASLVLVVVSASTTGVFVVMAAVITVRGNQQIHARLDDLHAQQESLAEQQAIDREAAAQ